MVQQELIALTFILVCGVSSLPWAKPGSAPPQGTSSVGGAKTPSEPKSVKFPNNSWGTAFPGDNVRSPPGGWAREKRPHGSSNNSRASPSDDGIVFPDDSDEKGTGSFVPKIGKSTDCAKDNTFCEAVDGYPSAYIEGILKNSALEIRGLFGNDFINDSTIAHRIDNTDENPLCASLESIVYPQSAVNKEQKWLFIINQGEYKQGVRVEKCVKQGESQSCEFTQGFPFGYRTYCKQKYIYRQLMAIDEFGERVMDSFQIPSCCACMVVTEGGPLRSRLGTPGLKSFLKTTKTVTTTSPTSTVKQQ